MSQEHRWVVVRTQTRQELLALHSVAVRDLETYFPVITRGRTSEPLFPGYIFARVVEGSDDVLRIRSVPGVAYILPRGAPPVMLPGDFVAALRGRASAGGPELRRGDRVTIRRGPFRWLDAMFDRRLNASGRVRVLLDFVDRTVSVDLRLEDLH
jgi:transcription antitermination factor NusG